MIYGFSDGAVSANTSLQEDDGNGTAKFRWESDDSQTAASFILVYSPTGRPALRNGAASQQLGAYRANGSVDTASSPFANSVTTLAELVVLNYLALARRRGHVRRGAQQSKLRHGCGGRTLHRVQSNR